MTTKNSLILFAMFLTLILSSVVFAGDIETEQINELKFELNSFGHGVAEALKGSGKKLPPVKISPTNTSGHIRTFVTEIGEEFEIKWSKGFDEQQNELFPAKLRLLKKGFRLPGEIVIGLSTRENIIAKFGKPISENDGNMHFLIPGYGEDDIISFNLKNGLLQSILWHWIND